MNSVAMYHVSYSYLLLYLISRHYKAGVIRVAPLSALPRETKPEELKFYGGTFGIGEYKN